MTGTIQHPPHTPALARGPTHPLPNLCIRHRLFPGALCGVPVCVGGCVPGSKVSP